MKILNKYICKIYYQLLILISKSTPLELINDEALLITKYYTSNNANQDNEIAYTDSDTYYSGIMFNELKIAIENKKYVEGIDNLKGTVLEPFYDKHTTDENEYMNEYQNFKHNINEKNN